MLWRCPISSLSLSPGVSGLSTELVSTTLHDVFPLIPSCWMCHDTSPHVSKTAHSLNTCEMLRSNTPKATVISDLNLLQQSKLWTRGLCSGRLLYSGQSAGATPAQCESILKLPIRSTWVDRCVRLWLLLTVSSTLAWYLPTTSWGMSKMTSSTVKGISFQCISYWFLHFIMISYPSLQPKVFGQRFFLLYPGASSNSLQALYLLRGRHPGHKGWGYEMSIGAPSIRRYPEHCIWVWVGLKGIAPALRASAFPVEISPRGPVHLHSIEVHLRMPVKKGQRPTTKVDEGSDKKKYTSIDPR